MTRRINYTYKHAVLPFPTFKIPRAKLQRRVEYILALKYKVGGCNVYLTLLRGLYLLGLVTWALEWLTTGAGKVAA